MKKYYKEKDWLQAIKDNECSIVEKDGLKMVDKNGNEYICLLLGNNIIKDKMSTTKSPWVEIAVSKEEYNNLLTKQYEKSRRI